MADRVRLMAWPARDLRRYMVLDGGSTITEVSDSSEFSGAVRLVLDRERAVTVPVDEPVMVVASSIDGF